MNINTRTVIQEAHGSHCCSPNNNGQIFDRCIFIKYDTKIFGQFSRGYLNIEPHLLSLVLFQQLRIKTISSCFNTQ